MQRMGCHAAFALIATALFSLPGFAAEPGGPANLITRIESVRITVEDRLSSGSPPSSVRKSEQDALINYYAISDQGLLWVDENGLSVRGSSITEERSPG